MSLRDARVRPAADAQSVSGNSSVDCFCDSLRDYVGFRFDDVVLTPDDTNEDIAALAAGLGAHEVTRRSCEEEEEAEWNFYLHDVSFCWSSFSTPILLLIAMPRFGDIRLTLRVHSR